MDLFKQAQQLTDAANNLVQAGTKSITESVEAAQHTAATLGTHGLAAVEQLKNTSSELMQQSSEALSQTVDTVTCRAAKVASFGVTTAIAAQQQSEQLTQQGLKTVGGTVDKIKSGAIEVSASGGAIANALKDLPKTAEELAREMPKLAYRLTNRAGLRVGDAPRSDADVIKLFEKIPGTAKLEGNETKIRQFLADKHGSHIISHKQGGSNGADNILWEVGTDNIRRGARVMTGGEQVYIRFYNAVDSIVKNSGTIARLGITATGTAILTQAIVTAVSYALDLYRGDITVEEFRDRVVNAAISAGIATPVFFLVFVAVLALFPELTLLLAAPAVVAGFNALFGIGIAVPIIQSLLRHMAAGSFGKEEATADQSLGDNTGHFLQASIEPI